jgi:hypothetical protein
MKIAELWRTKRQELMEAGNHVIELIRCEFLIYSLNDFVISEDINSVVCLFVFLENMKKAPQKQLKSPLN